MENEFIIKDNKNKKELITSFILFYISIIITIYINKSGSYITTLKKSIEFLGGSFFISRYSTLPLDMFISSIKKYTPQFLINDKKYHNIIYIKKQFSKLDIKPEQLNLLQKRVDILNYYIRDDRTFTNIKIYLEYLYIINTSLPLLKFNKEKNFEINNLLDFQNKEIKIILKEKIFKPLICNMYSNYKFPLNSIYLKGEPGTGKTYFVNNLSKIMSMDIHKYEPPKTFYYDRPFDHFTKLKDSDFDIKTILVYNMKKNKKHGVILFIDEIDKLLSKDKEGTLKKILQLINTNWSDEIYYDKTLEIDIDISNVLIICAGNKSLEDIDSSGSLKDRFITIEFEKIDDELKKTIAYTKYPDIPIEYIDGIVENDNNDGLRQIISSLNEYSSNKKCDEIFDNLLKS